MEVLLYRAVPMCYSNLQCSRTFVKRKSGVIRRSPFSAMTCSGGADCAALFTCGSPCDVIVRSIVLSLKHAIRRTVL